MRVTDSIPFRAIPSSVVELKPIAPARRASPPADGGAELRRAADRLVAGQVNGPIDGPIGGLLDVTVADHRLADQPGPLPLHARAADRHAAATGVELGRRIDITA